MNAIATPTDNWLADTFVPWRGRTVDVSKPVKVYRCLAPHGGRWSIHQSGRVVGHADEVVLTGAVFMVSAAGYRRRLRVGHKLVYAYVSGMIADPGMGARHVGDSLGGSRVDLYDGAFRYSAALPALASAACVALREHMEAACTEYAVVS